MAAEKTRMSFSVENDSVLQQFKIKLDIRFEKSKNMQYPIAAASEALADYEARIFDAEGAVSGGSRWAALQPTTLIKKSDLVSYGVSPSAKILERFGNLREAAIAGFSKNEKTSMFPIGVTTAEFKIDTSKYSDNSRQQKNYAYEMNFGSEHAPARPFLPTPQFVGKVLKQAAIAYLNYNDAGLPRGFTPINYTE